MRNAVSAILGSSVDFHYPAFDIHVLKMVLLD